MSAVRDIPRQRTRNEQAAFQRRVSESRLARYHAAPTTAERDALFEPFMPLARSLAARYKHTSESFDDLLQVA